MKKNVKGCPCALTAAHKGFNFLDIIQIFLEISVQRIHTFSSFFIETLFIIFNQNIFVDALLKLGQCK